MLHRFTLMLTPDEVDSLEATINELVSSWTRASPALLSKLRREVIRTKHNQKAASYKREKRKTAEPTT